MSMSHMKRVSSGIKGFDKIVETIYLGDNVVWQVDSISDYREFVLPFVEQAHSDGRRILYIRFAEHAPLFEEDDGRVEIHNLNAFSGFESFALDVHTIIGGVGLSYNTYVWQRDMEPEAGMVRIVFGLGTRAVDRVEGDYPRIVALDSPSRRSHAGMDDLKRFSQHNADVLNIDRNIIETVPVALLLKDVPDYKIDRVGTFDPETAAAISQMGLKQATPWLVSFDPFLSDTDFAANMRRLLATLRAAYNYHVDIEFTVNFSSSGGYRINLLQCRPYQAKGVKDEMIIPDNLSDENVFFRSDGGFLGGSVKHKINRIVYVDPEEYSSLTQSGKYEAARIVGRLNRMASEDDNIHIMLMGPGRWGTSTPSLGVPSKFAEINHVRVLVEIARMSDNIMPELSFGSHFFHDLIETGIFYVALFPEKEDVFINHEFFSGNENMLGKLVPEAEKYQGAVKVYDISVENFFIMADILSQRLVCFRNITEV